jgi:TatD DNase family protein
MNKKNFKLDAHFHLDLYKDYLRIIRELSSGNIHVLAVTNAPSVFHFTKKLNKTYPNILPAIGFHPELVKDRYSELDLLLKKIPNEKYIGEIGLDYSQKYSLTDRELQKNVFKRILQKCSEVGNRVISIHSRRASSDVINIVGNNFPGTIILHWYSGGVSDLDKAITYGFFFSVNPGMVRSKSGQKIISRIPPDRILTETDGPFLEHNDRPAEPQDISDVVMYLSNIWKTDTHEVNSCISNNIISAGILP